MCQTGCLVSSSDVRKQAASRPASWKVWYTASRPHTLTASVSPVVVGHCLSRYYVGDDVLMGDGLSPWQCTVPWALFCVLVQLGTNLHNDYADFVLGADTEKRVGHARATQKGWLTPRQTATAATTTLAAAFATGMFLLTSIHRQEDPFLFGILVTSIFNAFAYTGGPYPLGYIGLGDFSIGYWGLGDIFVFVYFGLVATCTVPYLIMKHKHHSVTGSTSLEWWNVFQQHPMIPTSAVQVACMATAILVVNNLRDRHTDVHAKKRTLAVQFGAAFCHVQYGALMCFPYLILPFQGMATKSAWLCLPLLSLPMAVKHMRAVIWQKDGSELNPYVGGTAKVQLLFCVLLCLAMMLSQ